MASRRRLSSHERRKQILRCAIRVFARRSYYGATTKTISEEAGVAEALIYRYFGNKRALFTAAVDHTGGRLIESIAAIVDAHGEDPAKTLSALLHYYLEILRRHQDFAKMIFWVSAELDDPEVASVYLPHQERALGLLQGTIESWQEAGRIRPGVSPRSAAWMILGSYQLLALMKHSGHLDEVNVRAVLDLAAPFLNPADASSAAAAVAQPEAGASASE